VQTIRRWIDQGAQACPCDESTSAEACPAGDPGFDAGTPGDAAKETAVDAADAGEVGDSASDTSVGDSADASAD
jgi:hypothetical protein